jgi:hypothetical protein
MQTESCDIGLIGLAVCVAASLALAASLRFPARPRAQLSSEAGA